MTGHSQWNDHLDPRNDSPLSDQVNEGRPIIGLLVESLVKEDDSADGLYPGLVCSEEKFSVLPPVLLGVLQPTGRQPLAHGAGGLVRSQNTFTLIKSQVSQANECVLLLLPLAVIAWSISFSSFWSSSEG